MTDWAARLASCLDTDVHKFDFSYVTLQKRAPPHIPALVPELKEAVRTASMAYPEAASRGIVLAGKSMGSRVILYMLEQLELEDMAVKACIFWGYPIGSLKKSSSTNAAERFSLVERSALPIMFIHGTRDRISSIERIREVVSARSRAGGAITKLHEVEAGDHSLAVTKSWLRENRTTQDEVDSASARAVTHFLQSLPG
jgi:predicted alpha/beta-hydrolase family hydrolase